MPDTIIASSYIYCIFGMIWLRRSVCMHVMYVYSYTYDIAHTENHAWPIFQISYSLAV